MKQIKLTFNIYSINYQGFAYTTVARMYVDSIYAWNAKESSKFDWQSCNRYRTDCLCTENNGSELELWRSSTAYSQLRPHLG